MLATFNIWKENSAPWVQAVQAAYSFGAFVGPMIVRPYVLPLARREEADEGALIVEKKFFPEDVKVFWPFLFVGLSLVLGGIPFLFYYFADRSKAKSDANHNTDLKIEVQEAGKVSSTLRQYIVIAILAVMFHCGFGVAFMLCK